MFHIAGENRAKECVVREDGAIKHISLAISSDSLSSRQVWQQASRQILRSSRSVRPATRNYRRWRYTIEVTFLSGASIVFIKSQLEKYIKSHDEMSDSRKLKLAD